MKSKIPTQSKFLVVIIFFIAVFAAAQVYKWVDEDGQVHFGDQPPDDQAPEELDLPTGPSEQKIERAKDDLRKTLESRRVRDEAEHKTEVDIEKEKELIRARKEESFSICVRATQQSAILELQVRIFKLNTDWSRTYLKNEDRPFVVSELEKQIEKHCKTDSESIKQQYTAALELSKALNIKCVNPKENLAIKILDPSKEDEYQDFVKSNCPAVDPRGYWIADWIHR